MSDDDDDFEPRLGRQRSKSGKQGRKFLHRVLAATSLAGGVRSAVNRRFDGSRIGRGASIGRLLGSRDKHAAFRSRRVIIKSRFVRLAGKGFGGAVAHLRYIERDGVTREGDPGELYGAETDRADGKEFLERGRADRHQFRFIVSAEDGADYDDLKPLTRRLMAQVELDLGTKLDWVAVDHFNTGNPHTHIMLRGVDDRGQNLVIAREYMGTGMRARLAELVTLDLGPQSTLEIEAKLRQDMTAERVTAIDRSLTHDMDDARIVSATGRNAFDQSLRAGRLQKLGRLGLAEHMGNGRWQLAEGFDDTLRQMSERGDIIRSLQREVTTRKLDRAVPEKLVFDTPNRTATPMIGRLVKRGLSDEHRDRHYLIVDGIDGKQHYVDIGKGEDQKTIPTEAIVRVTPRRNEPRAVDQTIARIAEQNGGRYDVDAHLKYDPGATENFAQTHVRRLEAMRKVMGSVEREADGGWIIAPDHLERAAAFEARQVRDRPVTIETLSSTPLDRLGKLQAATWLDREIVADTPQILSTNGFGGEVRSALATRRQWLVNQNLADDDLGTITYRPNMLATLQRRELLRVAGQLSDELGLAFTEGKPGAKIEGVVKRAVDLASGRHALIDRSRDFTLVPWRPVLEKQIGKSVSGIMRGDGISWTVGRGRGGPSIS